MATTNELAAVALQLPQPFENRLRVFPDVDYRLVADACLTWPLAVEKIYFRYYQSTYFIVLFPVYLISVAYDLIVWKLGIKKLSSQMLLVVRRPEM